MKNQTTSGVLVFQTTDYPAVVEIIAPDGTTGCTGTFISARAVLTASHCAQQSGIYSVNTSFGTFTTSNKATFGSGAPTDPNDIAVLYFDTDTAVGSPSQFVNLGTSVAQGDTLRLVGFGCNNFDTRNGFGVKRTGTNTVNQVDGFLEFFTRPRRKLVSLGRKTRQVLVSATRAAPPSRPTARETWPWWALPIQVARARAASRLSISI